MFLGLTGVIAYAWVVILVVAVIGIVFVVVNIKRGAKKGKISEGETASSERPKAQEKK